jgi:putative transposase
VENLFQGRFKGILIEKESYLLELCRYIVLNRLRVKSGTNPIALKWSSYPVTAGLVAVPEFLSPDWLLEQFGKNRRIAQKRYREFVRDGIANRPWDELKGQIYLGSDEFIERHSAEDKELREIPRAQQSQSTDAGRILPRMETGIAQAYREHGYRLQEIAAHLGVYYATVSRNSRR